MRITPKLVLVLKDNEIFVFGSNLSGLHGAGAAKLARTNFGAIMGIGEGLTGQSYALPTKGYVTHGQLYTLEISQIEIHVNRLYNHVQSHSGVLVYYITEVGCGLAGYKPSGIAPLFRDFLELENVYLPLSFINELKR